METIKEKISVQFNLENIGWNSVFEYYFSELHGENLIPARISAEDKGSYLLMSELGELRGQVSGAYRYDAKKRVDFPVVGDWVAVEAYSADSIAIIHELLPRKTRLSRKVTGAISEEQALAANIDYVFIISGLDHDFNQRRIERYLTLVLDEGATPVIILNKADLLASNIEKEKIKSDIDAIALGTKIHFVSCKISNNVDSLKSYFTTGKTVVLLGSSGVGKSTLTNLLLNTRQQKTSEVRISDSKGRHTTTRRQLFLLPSGGMLIDTPGIRELQLWLDDVAIDVSFSDIAKIAQHCRFKDCTHRQEPECAVQNAIIEGTIEPRRLHNYQKLLREAKHLVKRKAETSWDTRLADRKFGKLRHEVIKHQRKP